MPSLSPQNRITDGRGRGILERLCWKLGLQDLFVRPALVTSEAPADVLLSPSWGKVQEIAAVSADGRIPEKRTLGMPRFVELASMVSSEEMRAPFASGLFIKIYLAQWDPHGVAAPASGTVQSLVYEEGRSLPLVFLREADVTNEKTHILLSTRHGFPLLLSMIGSFLVRSTHVLYRQGDSCERGEMLGYFTLGSTVILLFPDGAVQPLCEVGEKLKLGEPIALCK
jgi:phosphatidylserine decarboxylase